MEDIHRRLAALERQNRLFKTLTIIVLALVGGIAAANLPAASIPTASIGFSTEELTARTVTATSFVLVDGDGRRTAELANGQIAFFDERGTTRIVLGTVVPSTTASCGGKTWSPADGLPSRLYFYDAEGNRRASWDNNANGWSTIAFFDPKGGPCANLNVSDDCRSGLHLGNSQRGAGMIWTDDGNQVNIDLVDTQNKVRWTTR